MEDIENNDIWHVLEPCLHVFHTKCIVQWFRRKGACPLCRDAPSPTSTQHPAEANTSAAVLNISYLEEEQHYSREKRNYMSRRNRLARTNKEIGLLRDRVHSSRHTLRSHDKVLEDAYREAERQVQEDVAIVKLKKEHSVAKRHFTRAEKRYRELTEALIGPEPQPRTSTMFIHTDLLQYLFTQNSS